MILGGEKSVLDFSSALLFLCVCVHSKGASGTLILNLSNIYIVEM